MVITVPRLAHNPLYHFIQAESKFSLKQNAHFVITSEAACVDYLLQEERSYCLSVHHMDQLDP